MKNDRLIIISSLKKYLLGLQSDKPKVVENTAGEISGFLIAKGVLDDRSDPVIQEICHLALDLEIPKKYVKEYDASLAKLRDLISKL